MRVSSKSWGVGLVSLMALAAAGCDSEASGDPGAPAESSDREETARERGAREWKWKIDYSGHLEGHLEGRSFVIVKAGPPEHLNFAVKTLQKSPGFTATLSVHDGKPTGFFTRVTLEGGTVCTPDDRSEVEILDTNKESFHATVEGNLKCGEAKDRKIDFEAVIRQR